jgi:thiamine pyrophosphokinase
MPSRFVIFANGSLPDLGSARHIVHPGDTILAADGGTRHALALGLIPSVIIGDLDSLTDEQRRITAAAGTRFVEHPRDKNETDLELAIHFAVREGARSIVVLGALGGRLDQTLANLTMLTDPSLAGLDIRLDDGVEEAFFLRAAASQRAQARIEGRSSDLVSLLPWGAPVIGAATEGLRWPLAGEILHPERTRGISNEMVGATASLSLQSGLLLVVHRRQSSSADCQS